MSDETKSTLSAIPNGKLSEWMDKVHAIPRLQQWEKEYLTSLNNDPAPYLDQDIWLWFYDWQQQNLTEDMANNFFLRRHQLLGELVLVIRPLIDFFRKTKRDFITHIDDGDKTLGEAIVNEVKQFYDDMWYVPDVSFLDPMQLWLIRESIEFLGTLKLKKREGITKDLQINAFGDKFTFRDGKMVEHISPTFTFDVNDWLKLHEYEPEWSKKIECYRRYYQDHDKQKVIAQDLGIAQSTISLWVDEVEYRIGYDLGHAFEDFFAKSRAPTLYKSYKKLGGIGQPDGIGEHEDGSIEVVSLKCYRESRNSVTIPRKELRPELEETVSRLKKGEKVKLHLFFREHRRGYEKDVFVDPNVDEPMTFPLPPRDSNL